MMRRNSSDEKITLRRDQKGPLKFNGERIGTATRTVKIEEFNEEPKSYEVSAQLFRTESGKYIIGVEVYNRTDEEYDSRDGWVSSSLEELAKQIPQGWRMLDNDILAEVFEDTEIADQFVERID
jgi:hypothetical protein